MRSPNFQGRRRPPPAHETAGDYDPNDGAVKINAQLWAMPGNYHPTLVAHELGHAIWAAARRRRNRRHVLVARPANAEFDRYRAALLSLLRSSRLSMTPLGRSRPIRRGRPRAITPYPTQRRAGANQRRNHRWQLTT